MDEKELRQYSFLRIASKLILEGSWPLLKSKMLILIKEIEKTPMDYQNVLLLKSAIEDFERLCINKVINFENSLRLKNVVEDLEKLGISEEIISKIPKKDLSSINEADIFNEIIHQLPLIYTRFFDPFLSPVTIKSKNSWHNIMPDSIKFRAYNLDLRFRKQENLAAGKTDMPSIVECDFENGYELSKHNVSKGQLYQGYWQMDSLITELRNYVEHWEKRGAKQYLEKTLNRKMEDSLSEIESPGNLIVLVNVLILVCYHFMEVLQTWLDTSRLIK